jgi:hypothetical protein
MVKKEPTIFQQQSRNISKETDTPFFACLFLISPFLIMMMMLNDQMCRLSYVDRMDDGERRFAYRNSRTTKHAERTAREN